MNNPDFDKTLERMRNIYHKKNHDYAENDNPYSNFEITAKTAGVSVNQIFVVFIATKLSRLSQLIAKGKEPNNESIQDTIIDIANYAAIWATYLNKNGVKK